MAAWHNGRIKPCLPASAIQSLSLSKPRPSLSCVTQTISSVILPKRLYFVRLPRSCGIILACVCCDGKKCETHCIPFALASSSVYSFMPKLNGWWKVDDFTCVSTCNLMGKLCIKMSGCGLCFTARHRVSSVQLSKLQLAGIQSKLL